MDYRVTHTTTYNYSEPVSLCHNLAHLTPRNTSEQQCLDTNLVIRPQPAVLCPRTDSFGNQAVFFAIQEPHRQLTVCARHHVQLQPGPKPELAGSPPWEEVRDLLRATRDPDVLEAYQFVFDSRYAPTRREYSAYALPSFAPRRPLLEAVAHLTGRIHHDFLYDPRATTVATPLQEVFSKRRGVCQDFAHLEIACLRSLGLAARYVSGYLCTSVAPGQRRVVGADATHAWLSVYCPDCNWLDVDPTNDQVGPSNLHIPLAWGRDYEDVSPIKGVILGGGEHTIQVAVAVLPKGAGNGSDGLC